MGGYMLSVCICAVVRPLTQFEHNIQTMILRFSISFKYNVKDASGAQSSQVVADVSKLIIRRLRLRRVQLRPFDSVLYRHCSDMLQGAPSHASFSLVDDSNMCPWNCYADIERATQT